MLLWFMICQEEKFLTNKKINNNAIKYTNSRGSTVYVVKIKLDNGQVLTQRCNLLMVSIVIFRPYFDAF
jgi:folate-dependent phosphoribosylglycinamide formyltransferase PurN